MYGRIGVKVCALAAANGLMAVLFKSKTKRSQYSNTLCVQKQCWKTCGAAIKIWWRAANLEGIKSNPTNGPKIKAKAVISKKDKIYAWKASQTKNAFSKNSKSVFDFVFKNKKHNRNNKKILQTFFFEKFSKSTFANCFINIIKCISAYWLCSL